MTSRSTRLDTERGAPVSFSFNGQPVAAHAGETLAAALMAHGVEGVSLTRDGEPRQPLCNMGTCFDCAVTVDGRSLVRSCLTPVEDGMEVHSWQNH
ncbi:(2Fe-2S)-binding protein [Ornithinimicrobium cavernae]|uniref:(2Fe-2S)-binding protein n=1 Tax=Ornithinimicrobium cavernae TaxID=2666047 RepID=UPI000D69B1BA|nr:(2Fe-2S)-binding protein [Ornithinimicrobium cavernae]